MDITAYMFNSFNSCWWRVQWFQLLCWGWETASETNERETPRGRGTRRSISAFYPVLSTTFPSQPNPSSNQEVLASRRWSGDVFTANIISLHNYNTAGAYTHEAASAALGILKARGCVGRRQVTRPSSCWHFYLIVSLLLFHWWLYSRLLEPLER